MFDDVGILLCYDDLIVGVHCLFLTVDVFSGGVLWQDLMKSGVNVWCARGSVVVLVRAFSDVLFLKRTVHNICD